MADSERPIMEAGTAGQGEKETGAQAPVSYFSPRPARNAARAGVRGGYNNKYDFREIGLKNDLGLP